jgi:threonine aldolase
VTTLAAPIDLRSDTVTKPTPAMREAIARAEVGDDVYGEDPTVRRLEEEVAALLGKEAALFVPSGVMANQLALACSAAPGDEVLVPFGAHCLLYESGAAAALSGLELREIGDPNGVVRAADVAAAIQPDNVHFPRTTLVTMENTHNRAGGRVLPDGVAEEVAALLRARGIGLHLDGARLWNAAVARGVDERALAAPFDTVSVCLSKGLGAPVGSLVAGTAAFVARARRRRKMLGGGMRQAGILAAAGLYAIAHHRARLADDHARARRFAQAIAGLPGVRVDLDGVQTNIVVWDLLPEVPFDAPAFVARARDAGVLLNAMGTRRVRAVTHLDVDDAACAEAAARVAALHRGA